MCKHCDPGVDCAHDRETDTWVVPGGLTSTDSGPVQQPQMGRDGGESDVH